MTIVGEIRRFIADELAHPEIARLTDDDDLLSSGVLDSMAVVQLITFLEQRYSISFDFSTITEETFSTTSNLALAVRNQLAAS